MLALVKRESAEGLRLEEVPEPDHNKILVDGETEGDEAVLKNLAAVLNEAEIEWEPLQDETDPTGTGIIYNANEWVEEPVARTPPPLEPIVPNSGNRLMTSSFTGLMVFRKAGDISSPVEADVPG